MIAATVEPIVPRSLKSCQIVCEPRTEQPSCSSGIAIGGGIANGNGRIAPPGPSTAKDDMLPASNQLPFAPPVFETRSRSAEIPPDQGTSSEQTSGIDSSGWSADLL